MNEGTGRSKIHELIAEEEQSHLARVREFLSQPSVSQEGEEDVRACAELLRGYYEELGCHEIETAETPGLPGVWAHYDAGAPKTLAVYAFFDTNVVTGDWTYEPYDATLADHPDFGQVIYAPGPNNKGAFIAFLNALAAIRKTDGDLPVNLMFVSEGEEWLGSPHIPLLIERYGEQLSQADAFLRPRAVQAGTGTVPVYLGNKGCIHIELECSGDRWGQGPKNNAVHSSLQCVVESPVWRLIQALKAFYDPEENRILMDGFYEGLQEPTPEEIELVEALAERYVGQEASVLPGGSPDRIAGFIDELDGRDLFLRYCFQPTMNISGLRAGYTGPGTRFWTTPHAAYCNLDARLPAELDPEVSIQKIRDCLDERGYTDIGITVLESTPSAYTLDVEDEEYKAAMRVFEDWGVDTVIWPRAGSGGPTGHFSRLLDLKPLVSAGVGHTGGSRDGDFLVVGGNDKVGGLVELEQSFVDLLYSYAAYPSDF